MSRTQNPSSEQPSSLDAWQQHDAFYAKFKNPAIRQTLAVARTHLQPVFIENARFSEDCGLPTVSLSFLVDSLRETNIIPPLTSHNYKLGLQICISPDLTSPLRSPSKNHCDQRIHFDTFVEAFAFSIFCYPIEERLAAFSSAPPFCDEQQIECFADDISTAVHRFIDSSRVKARHNFETALQKAPDASENGSLSNSVSTSPNSEPRHQNIQEERTGHQTKGQSNEQLPSTPVQQTEGREFEMKFPERRSGARELRSNSEREHATSHTPVHFYTPRSNFPAASPRRLPVNSFPTTPGTLKWFTPRHSIAKLSPDVQKAVQMRQANTVSPNQPLCVSFETTTTSATPPLPETNRELISPHDESPLPVADSLQDKEAPPVGNPIDYAKDMKHIGSDGCENSDGNTIEDIGDWEEQATLSPESNFQSPELGDGPPPLLQVSTADADSSRKLLFCESEDEGNMSDESSRYESEGERSTPAFKLSQIEEFGQHIEDPGEVSDFEGEGNATRVEGTIDERGESAQSTASEGACQETEIDEVHSVQELETVEDVASEVDACIDVTGMSPSGVLPDRCETSSLGLSFDVSPPLFGNVLSPGSSNHSRSDFGFDSFGECEQAELLYNCGNMSESSELSMRTRETYSRMLDTFIESGSFGYEVTSSNAVAEDDYTPSVQCCLNLESIMEDACHEEQQAGSAIQDSAPAHPFPGQPLLNRIECTTEEKPNVIDQEPVTELGAQDSGDIAESKHTTHTVVSHALSKRDNETFGSEIRSYLPRTMDACCEEIVDPHACAPLQDSTETTSSQCASEEAEKGSVASEMATKDEPVSNNDDLTPEDFDVVRKPIKTLTSFNPFSGSPLGSLCTKTSDEHREIRMHSHTLRPQAHRKSLDVDQDPVSDASDKNKPKEQTIVVQCNSHVGESHMLAALRENTELCRMLREEVEARRRADSFWGRMRDFLEGVIIIVIVGWITLMVLDNWIARSRFTKVLM